MSRQSPNPPTIDLSGRWRAHERDPELAKRFADDDFDDGNWPEVHVPHHWRAEPAFVESDGPLLYRRVFDGSPDDATVGPDSDPRWFLQLDGIFYYGDTWFDGEYLGATEGYFAPHAFEVTNLMRDRREHVLAIEVGCPPQLDAGAKRTLTGGYWHSPAIDPAVNPGGLWRPVRIVGSGPVRIADARVVCVEASVERGRLACALTLDAGTTPRDAQLHAVLRGPDDTLLLDAWKAATLATGSNELTWTLTVEEPPRWWPRTLGRQPLCDLELTVEVDHHASDTRTFRTAFREVRERHDGIAVNGERLFLKGAAYEPARPFLDDVDDDLLRADVARAVDANLDLLRVHTHIAPAALYDAADEAGLLLWQDMPMTGGYARGVRRQAARQAREMVSLLAHHPSIALWCAHDAPLGDDTGARILANAVLPTWGKDVLDRSTARAIARTDPTRPIVRSSGGINDSHLFFGWRHGRIGDLAPAIRAVPRLGRFVAAFGAPALPDTSDWIDPQRWPALDFDALAAHHGYERAAFDEHVPPADAKTFEEWRDATQAYQAALLQLQIEDLRRCKGSPTAGFAISTFADPAPAVGFGLLDHARVPKRAFAAVQAACRTVLPVIDPRTGNVHVVNDARHVVDDAQIEAAVDGRVRRWQGAIGADSVVFVGTVELHDAVDVEIVLHAPALGRVTNRYPLRVLEAGRRDRQSP